MEKHLNEIPNGNKINRIEIEVESSETVMAYKSTRYNAVSVYRGALYNTSREWSWIVRRYDNVTPASMVRVFCAMMALQSTWVTK